ncbi:MAG: serine hydrolase domain-containing protein [Nevskiales bacterium]
MKLIKTIFSAALMLASCATQAAALAYQTIPGVSPVPITEGAGLKSPQELEAFIDGIMAAHLRAQHIAGATIAVVKDGELFFAKGYGYADVDKQIPVVADKTLFRPGSIGKLMTWTALMQLVEQGKVELDADVNTYLTQFQIPDTFEQPITVRNLFTHTPGLEDRVVGLLVRSLEEMEQAAEGLAAHMPARVRPPTTEAKNLSYSNWGAALAGLIVANVSGMSYAEYVEQNIFEPLDMRSSSFRQPEPSELADRLSKGYKYEAGRFDAKGIEYFNLPFVPAGSMWATATDMARFMIAHLNHGAYRGKRILQEDTAKLMHSRMLSPSPYLAGVGLGFVEKYINGRRLVWHNGGSQWFFSDLNLLTEEDVGIFVSVNTATALPLSTHRDLLKAFMDRYYPAELPKLTPPEGFAERASHYAGSYLPDRHSHTTIEKILRPLFTIKVTPTENDTLLLGAGPNAAPFVEVAPKMFREVDGDQMMAFSENEDGELEYLLVGPFVAHKLAWWETTEMLGLFLAFALLCFVAAIISALRHWRADRKAEPNARRARRLAATVAAINIAFVIMLVLSFLPLSKDLAAGWPALLYYALALPLLAIPLTLAVVYLAWQAWRKGWWTRYGRAQYSVIALLCVLFLWSLHSFNLIGFNFS